MTNPLAPKNLVRLEGCEECIRVKCPWNGAVASPLFVDKTKSKYGCNSSLREEEDET